DRLESAATRPTDPRPAATDGLADGVRSRPRANRAVVIAGTPEGLRRRHLAVAPRLARRLKGHCRRLRRPDAVAALSCRDDAPLNRRAAGPLLDPGGLVAGATPYRWRRSRDDGRRRGQKLRLRLAQRPIMAS